MVSKTVTYCGLVTALSDGADISPWSKQVLAVTQGQNQEVRAE